MNEKRLDQIFKIIGAKSKGIDDYDPGTIPFVTSTEANNGVVAYVMPEPGDRVFNGPALVISGLGFATVQVGPFLPKGNGGDSLTVMKPLKKMPMKSLISIAASFNVLHQWRFGFGRKASIDRLSGLEIPFPLIDIGKIWRRENTTLSSIVTDLSESLKSSVNPFTENELTFSIDLIEDFAIGEADES